MSDHLIGFYQSPFGVIKYQYDQRYIYQAKFVFDDFDLNAFNQNINEAFDQYFKGEIKTFDFNFYLENLTPFQKDVCQALLNIKYGITQSYSDIARLIGRPKAVRAVGQACKNNPIAVMIPCHRVIGKNHKLTGYQGKSHIDIKLKLLNLEKNIL